MIFGFHLFDQMLNRHIREGMPPDFKGQVLEFTYAPLKERLRIVSGERPVFQFIE